MTESDQLRVALAERLGWTYIEKLALTGIPKGSRGNADARVNPDLATLVRSAEQGLSDEQKASYAMRLSCAACGHDRYHRDDWPEYIDIFRIRTASDELAATALLEVMP